MGASARAGAGRDRSSPVRGREGRRPHELRRGPRMVPRSPSLELNPSLPMQHSNSGTTSSASMEEVFNDLLHKGEAFLRPRWERVEEDVRNAPTKAVLIAAGIGYLLHRLPVR